VVARRPPLEILDSRPLRKNFTAARLSSQRRRRERAGVWNGWVWSIGG
jgi:hypothetical protein